MPGPVLQFDGIAVGRQRPLAGLLTGAPGRRHSADGEGRDRPPVPALGRLSGDDRSRGIPSAVTASVRPAVAGVGNPLG